MKLSYFPLALLCLGVAPVFGQELLSDSTFLSGFEAKSISLKELKIKRNPTWMLVAGTTVKDTIAYTEEEDQAFRLYADSIEGQRADLYAYDKEICVSRCNIEKFECLKRTLEGKGDAGVCDSIYEQCIERCAEIKQICDSKLDDSLENIWNLHEYSYRYLLKFAFSPRKKGIPLSSHADSLTLCLAKGFAPSYASADFSWFIVTKRKKVITAVDTHEKLLALLGSIDSYAKAYLVLCAAGYTAPYTFPQETFRLWTKQSDDGFYFMVPLQLPDSSNDSLTGLVLVAQDGTVTLVEKR